MAFNSLGSLDGYVPGFKASNEGASLLGGTPAKKYETESALAGNAFGSVAQLKGQEALARAQMYAADKQFQAATDPFTNVLGVFGDVAGAFAGGFGGGIGGAAGKKWFG